MQSRSIHANNAFWSEASVRNSDSELRNYNRTFVAPQGANLSCQRMFEPPRKMFLPRTTLNVRRIQRASTCYDSSTIILYDSYTTNSSDAQVKRPASHHWKLRQNLKCMTSIKPNQNSKKEWYLKFKLLLTSSTGFEMLVGTFRVLLEYPQSTLRELHCPSITDHYSLFTGHTLGLRTSWHEASIVMRAPVQSDQTFACAACSTNFARFKCH